MSTETIPYDIASQVLELTVTMGEGVNHLEKQLSELRLEESWGMLEDIITGFMSIEQALKPYDNINENIQLQELEAAVQRTFRRMLEIYPSGDINHLYNIAALRLKTVHRAWTADLEKVLRPYIVQ